MADPQDPNAKGVKITEPVYKLVTSLSNPSLTSDLPKTTLAVARDVVPATLPATKKDTKAEEARLRQELSYLTQKKQDYITVNNLTPMSGGKYGRPEQLSADDKLQLSTWQQLAANAKTDQEREYAQGKISEIGGKAAADPTVLEYDNQIGNIKDQISLLNSNESDIPDDKEKGGGGSGAIDAATAYLKTETRKTSEVKRQFDDFMNRAEGYYGLVKDEQSLYGNASDQYYQDIANAKKNHMVATPSLPVQTPWGSGLSGIVRPSIPNYVRPDYRLNEAVGLPGKEGFDNPNYDENGMPKYAHGTQPPLGSGERFSKLSQAVGSDALAAWIGRKKYGDKKMQSMAAAGKKKTPKYANGTSEFAALLGQLKAENRVPIALWPKKEFSFEPRGIQDQVMPNGG